MPLDLSVLDNLTLLAGSHKSREDGVCAMEAIAWVAGKAHGDHPVCVCPIIGGFLRSWNDAIPDNETRTRLLKPLIPLAIDTVADQETRAKRSFLCMDWIVREFVPVWMEYVESLIPHAATFRLLPEITSWELLIDATPVLVDAAKQSAAARDTARDAAWPAARDAARHAAGTAAGTTAWAAAGTAAGTATLDAALDAAWTTARDAARAAAGAAAGDAARDTARDAAWDALKPIICKLQESAADLVRRMCEMKPQSPHKEKPVSN
jgi:hypothetical protein